MGQSGGSGGTQAGSKAGHKDAQGDSGQWPASPQPHSPSPSFPGLPPSTSPLPFPWKPGPLHPRASTHGLPLPTVLFTPPFAGVTPLFLLVSDGCQVLKDLRSGLPPPSPALMEPQYVTKMPPVYTASSVSTGLLPDSLSVYAGHRQWTRMHSC